MVLAKITTCVASMFGKRVEFVLFLKSFNWTNYLQREFSDEDRLKSIVYDK